MTPQHIFRVYGVAWQENGEPDLSRYTSGGGGGAHAAWRRSLWFQGVHDRAAQERIIRAAVERFKRAKADARRRRVEAKRTCGRQL